MGLAALFGDKPRVRLLEALLRLAPVPFTRAELAQEAGLQKSSTNRVFQQLVAEAFVVKVPDTDPQEFQVVPSNPYVEILHALDAGLDLIAAHGSGSAVGQDAAQAFRRSVVRSVLAAHDVPIPLANVQTTPAGSAAIVARRSGATRFERRSDFEVSQ